MLVTTVSSEQHPGKLMEAAHYAVVFKIPFTMHSAVVKCFIN